MQSIQKYSGLLVLCLAASVGTVIYKGIGIFSTDFVFTFLLVGSGLFLVLKVVSLIAESICLKMISEIKSLIGIKETAEESSSIQAYIDAFLETTETEEIITDKISLIAKDLRNYEPKIYSRFLSENSENKNQERIELAKKIRHDIRSPLSSMQAAYELLDKNDMTAPAIATAIKRIHILIDDLNEVDKVYKKPTLVIAEVNLEDTVTTLSSRFKSEKNVTLTLEYDENLLNPINIREKDFTTAIESLLKNSLEAVDLNGLVNLKIERKLNKCIITVEDNGCGISPENVPNLFSKGGTFGKAHGVGLGLYHAKKTIESFGATIAYIPQIQGAKFQIQIPIVQTGVVFSGLPKTSTIKIIDDDLLVPRTLLDIGYKITEHAKTFELGQDLLARSTLESEIILIDNRLEIGKYGTALIAQQARRKNIYLCTNDYDDSNFIDEARSLGVKILPKPLVFSHIGTNLNMTTFNK